MCILAILTVAMECRSLMIPFGIFIGLATGSKGSSASVVQTQFVIFPPIFLGAILTRAFEMLGKLANRGARVSGMIS